MNINPGELNKRIDIVTIGSKTGEKTLHRSCYAKVSNTTGSEIKRNGLEIEDTKTRFLVRFSPVQITTKMEIIYNRKRYNIIYVNNYDESNEYLEIIAVYKGLSYES